RKITYYASKIGLVILFGMFIVIGYERTHSAEIGFQVTDHYINHRSVDGVYAQSGMNPEVKLFLREVMKADGQGKAASNGKALLFLHGGTTPSLIAYDMGCENCSVMRHFANAGWDTFALDFEGFGLSTPQPSVENPKKFPTSPAPTNTEVTVANVARAVEFIRELRHVDKIYLFGWSMSASRPAPLYAIQSPGKVAKLVLFAPAYRSLGDNESMRYQADGMEGVKIMSRGPLDYGSYSKALVPGLAKQFPGARVPRVQTPGQEEQSVPIPLGWMIDAARAKVQFDASRLTVPTLVIRGSKDTFWGSSEDSRQLVQDLGSSEKKYVEIPDGSHVMHIEIHNQAFFQEVLKFLGE
ncbi:MAG: lysophospholipase, partial [Deltaproteobacteria bacterium]|nr:lysophospholipase [Deltaproteobacteria bacterium]